MQKPKNKQTYLYETAFLPKFSTVHWRPLSVYIHNYPSYICMLSLWTQILEDATDTIDALLLWSHYLELPPTCWVPQVM